MMANEYGTGTGTGTGNTGSTGTTGSSGSSAAGYDTSTDSTSGYGSSVDSATDMKSKAREALSGVKGRAGEKIETTITEQKTRAAGTLSGVAASLMTSSQQMRSDGQEDVSRYIEKAADQVDRFANYLQSADVQEVVGRVEGFARRQPAAFMAGAFAVGFLASRFLKSSREEIDYYSQRSFGSGSRSYSYDTGYESNADRVASDTTGYGTAERGYGSTTSRDDTDRGV